ncbi:multiple epidermal growth factor-like domains protein 6 [Saccostrea cucullata]|uniref:multiple epidermal growth factor-like domains protein 6 n=1 Tax=Saccostrea cuccullata TaxID=36930 RepID=UPI002ED0DAAB
MTGQKLLGTVTVILAGLISMTNGQFGTRHSSHHGMDGDVRCIYCTPGTCDNVTGTCGQCLDGFFGKNCKETCPNTCLSCDKTDGKCKSCVNGWFGEKCEQECQQCDTCNKVTGACASCLSNKWGKNCQNLCEDGCQRCEVLTGTCQVCANGFYGERCNLNCSICRQGLCDRENGKCLYGCNDGRHGEKCEKECSNNCRVCNQADGSCLMCEPPLWGEYCDTKCPTNCDYCNITTGDCLECNPGFHGKKCTNDCNNCLDGFCEKDTGYCQGSCLDGWFGAKCDKKCMKNCRRCAAEDKCMLCEKGLAGEQCDIKCPERCPTCVTDMFSGDIKCMECSGEFKIPEKNCSCTSTKCIQLKESSVGGFTCGKCATGWYLREGTCCPCHRCAGGNQFCDAGGICKKGCEPKYFPETEGCDQYCDIPHCTWCESFYGHGKICKGCDQGHFLKHDGCEPCSSYCKGGSFRCDQKTGVCLDGCEKGGYGEKCDSLCPDKHCPLPVCDIQNCDVCEKSTDSAAKCKKCKTGYHTYKGKCRPCSSNCLGDVCDEITGTCIKGCKPGWTKGWCNVKKSEKKFNPRVKLCRGNCFTCDAMTGECANCHAGSWGSRCNKICPENCRTCDIKTGKCVVLCSRYCKQTGNELSPCDSITGECLNGCLDGWLGKRCRYRCIGNEKGKCMITRKPLLETIYFKK